MVSLALGKVLDMQAQTPQRSASPSQLSAGGAAHLLMAATHSAHVDRAADGQGSQSCVELARQTDCAR